MDILDCTKDGTYKFGSVTALLSEISMGSNRALCYSRFGILPPCTYAVKELATRAEVKNEVEIMRSLCNDERQVPVGYGDSHLKVIM